MLGALAEFGLLNCDEKAIAGRVAIELMAATTERDEQRPGSSALAMTSRYEGLLRLAPMTPEQLRSLPEYPAMTMAERAALLTTPNEEVSEGRREWVCLVDALQSLASNLYWAKKGQHHTTRVR